MLYTNISSIYYKNTLINKHLKKPKIKTKEIKILIFKIKNIIKYCTKMKIFKAEVETMGFLCFSSQISICNNNYKKTTIMFYTQVY